MERNSGMVLGRVRCTESFVSPPRRGVTARLTRLARRRRRRGDVKGDLKGDRYIFPQPGDTHGVEVVCAEQTVAH